jgi:Uma2 family endonuclease
MAIDQMTLELRATRRKMSSELSLMPLQGMWTEEQYLKLSASTNHLIEFTDGAIEVLPMPTSRHQKIIALLYRKLFTLIDGMGGIVLFAALRMYLRQGKYREPDLLVLLDKNDPRAQDEYWYGADMVVEVVSPDDPDRDLVVKRADYAEAGIPEYWIVNPLNASITVLVLRGHAYNEHGVFQRGDLASSVLLEGFSIQVAEVLDAVV